jgi:RNA polymerase sigma-70 factor (ECF subfamily)
LRAFSQLSSFRAVSSLGTWLGRIVLNEAFGRLRRRRPTVELTESPDQLGSHVIPFPLAHEQINPERTLAQREIHFLLERIIDALPDNFRAVLMARAVEGMSIEETSELLDLNPNTNHQNE